MNLANTEQINEVLALVKSRREEIKNSPSVYPVGKNTYFVDSLCGSDKNLALLEEKGVWENNKFYKLKSELSGVDGFNPPIDL